MTKNNRLTIWILIAMVLGIAVGYAMHHGMELQARKEVAENLKILTDIFLRLVKMIIAPLVFSTLVVGLAKLGAKLSLCGPHSGFRGVALRLRFAKPASPTIEQRERKADAHIECVPLA